MAMSRKMALLRPEPAIRSGLSTRAVLQPRSIPNGSIAATNKAVKSWFYLPRILILPRSHPAPSLFLIAPMIRQSVRYKSCRFLADTTFIVGRVSPFG